MILAMPQSMQEAQIRELQEHLNLLIEKISTAPSPISEEKLGEIQIVAGKCLKNIGLILQGGWDALGANREQAQILHRYNPLLLNAKIILSRQGEFRFPPDPRTQLIRRTADQVNNVMINLGNLQDHTPTAALLTKKKESCCCLQ
jgi:hypothetical protein